VFCTSASYRSTLILLTIFGYISNVINAADCQHFVGVPQFKQSVES